jgi:hypothetical protein
MVEIIHDWCCRADYLLDKVFQRWTSVTMTHRASGWERYAAS